jgi:hypothetical protein
LKNKVLKTRTQIFVALPFILSKAHFETLKNKELKYLYREVCRQQEASGRISSPRPTLVGAHLARTWLDTELDTEPARLGTFSFFECEKMCKLVCYRGLPLGVLQKKLPSREPFSKFGTDCRGKCLGQDLRIPREAIGAHRFFSPFGRGKKLLHASEKFAAKKPPCHYPMYDDTKFEAMLLCGLPALGKYDWYETNFAPLLMVNLDEIRWKLKVKTTDKQGIVIQEDKNAPKSF